MPCWDDRGLPSPEGNWRRSGQRGVVGQRGSEEEGLGEEEEGEDAVQVEYMKEK